MVGAPLHVSPMGEWAPTRWGGHKEWGEGMEAPLLVLLSFFPVSPFLFVVPVSFSTPMHTPALPPFCFPCVP